MSETKIVIDDVEYDQDTERGCIKHDGEWMAIFVRPKRKQTALRSLCVMDEDGWTQHVIQLPKGWEVAIDGKVVE